MSNYYGWIQDVRIIPLPLANAEIFDLYKPNKYYVFIQSECRCPNDYPINQDSYSTNCLRNNPRVVNSLAQANRLNEFSHNIGFLNDNNLDTTWISCIATNPITFVIDLTNGIYILQRIEIFFSSFPPTSLILQRLYNQKWTQLQAYSLNCSTADSGCTQLPR